MPRIIGWFSQGAASASAIAHAIKINNSRPEPLEFIVANIFLKEEYDDGGRFFSECENLFGQPILHLRDEKYKASVDEVVRVERFMSGPQGAKCTKVLKKAVRLKFQRPDDIHVFGLTVGEEHRVDQLLDTEPDLQIWTPLIEMGWTKENCFEFITQNNIELPKMYQLGYHNNNCVGCLKAGGAGYWNKIRKDFPEVFAIRAKQEQLLNVSLVKMSLSSLLKFPGVYEAILEEEKLIGRPILKKNERNTCRVPLRFLPEDAGTFKDLDIGSCGFFCETLDVNPFKKAEEDGEMSWMKEVVIHTQPA